VLRVLIDPSLGSVGSMIQSGRLPGNGWARRLFAAWKTPRLSSPPCLQEALGVLGRGSGTWRGGVPKRDCEASHRKPVEVAMASCDAGQTIPAPAVRIKLK
jgi:hypothetical protein